MKKAKRGTAENATSAPQGTNGSSTSESTLFIMDAYRSTWRKRNRWKKRHGSQDSKRYPGRNRHHNWAKSLGGPDADWNLILLKVERHNLLHKIFGVRTLKEIIAVLERLDRMKDRQKRVA